MWENSDYLQLQNVVFHSVTDHRPLWFQALHQYQSRERIKGHPRKMCLQEDGYDSPEEACHSDYTSPHYTEEPHGLWMGLHIGQWALSVSFSQFVMFFWQAGIATLICKRLWFYQLSKQVMLLYILELFFNILFVAVLEWQHWNKARKRNNN